MMERVTFNGICLSDFYQVLDATRPATGRSNSTTDVAGMDGSMFTGTRLLPSTLTVSLLMKDMCAEERRDALRNIAGMIAVDKPAKLMYGSDNGLYYMAMPDGEVPLKEYPRGGVVSINFVAMDPFLHGEDCVVVVPSGGSATFYVGGTYRTALKISGTVNGNESNLWGLRIDDGDYIRVNTGSTEGRTVSIDCGERVAVVNGTTVLPTLDSDWLVPRPGTHVLANDIGSGECTVEWQETWL